MKRFKMLARSIASIASLLERRFGAPSWRGTLRTSGAMAREEPEKLFMFWRVRRLVL